MESSGSRVRGQSRGGQSLAKFSMSVLMRRAYRQPLQNRDGAAKQAAQLTAGVAARGENFSNLDRCISRRF